MPPLLRVTALHSPQLSTGTCLPLHLLELPCSKLELRESLTVVMRSTVRLDRL